MITNRNILCISTPPWESNYASTTVQLMRELAKHNKVLFVNNPFTTKDVLDGVQKKKTVPLQKVFGVKERLKTLPVGNRNNVYVLTPPMTLSVQFLAKGFLYNFLVRFNGWLVCRTIQRYLKRLHMQKDLIHIVSFNPALGLELGRKFNERILLYLCYDEIEAAPHLKKHGVWQEQKFATLADAIIVTSQGLYERKKHLSPNCYIVKNAADFSLFSKAFNNQIPAKKQVGFIGGIDRRLDYPLLEYVIKELPEIEFIFIGRIVFAEGEQILRKYKNVHILGPKNITELPNFVKSFSAGIIPFKRSEFIKTVYPLKLNEYLAAGLPVVTTNFSYLDEFKNIVSIAETAQAFKAMLLMELAQDTIEKRGSRQMFAQSNTWEHRAEELSGVIAELEHQRK